MVRPSLKGGVWTNVEDEILKVAVMKYGKNQWARISSLLVRKTPKQCKARWTEWLDPSIRKTEWSKEEDERLLHLAKLMPTQWRTIAPLVGRTAAQCLERYESLLDAAQRIGMTPEEALAAKNASLEEAKKLRPGEVDVMPENRPARPDPVDMDEDEKEMLSEARARLANTQGKKAKRKAREKMLEEARRMSSLQKRRELREAGVVGRSFVFNQKRKDAKNLNYNFEVPFQRHALPGLHDPTEELRQEAIGRARYEKRLVEGLGKDAPVEKTRDNIEAEVRKHDVERQKERAEKLGTAFLPAYLAKKLAEQQAIRRGALSLPEPQLTAADLETLAKYGQSSDLALALNSATPASAALQAGARTASSVREFMTPLKQAGSSTPRTGTMMAPKLMTPIRDPLGINRPSFEEDEPALDIMASLRLLPPPKNEYELLLPNHSGNQ